MSTLPIIGSFFKQEQIRKTTYHLHKRKPGADFGTFYEFHKADLAKRSYLPDIASETATLIYLTTISNDENKSPFTQTQHSIFKKSYRANYVTKKGLIVGLVAIAVLSLFGALFNYFAVLAGLNDEDYAITALTLTSTAILIVTVVSFILTGNLPDRSSIHANIRQNSINLELCERFDACAIKLVSLHDHPQKKRMATPIAQAISFKALARAFKTYDKGIDNQLINRYLAPLRHARALVLGKQKPLIKGSAAYKSFLCTRKYQMRIKQIETSEDEAKIYPKGDEGTYLVPATEDRISYSEEETD